MSEDISIDRGTIYEMYSDLKTLKDTHLRHSAEMKAGIQALDDRVRRMGDTQALIEKGLIDRIHGVERTSLEKVAELGQKIAVAMFFVTVCVSIATGIVVNYVTNRITRESYDLRSNPNVDKDSRVRAGDSREKRLFAYPKDLGVSQGDYPQSN